MITYIAQSLDDLSSKKAPSVLIIWSREKSNLIANVYASSCISVSIRNFVLWSLMFIKMVWKIGQIVKLRST